jgi:NADH-quinone oxidoreductase subunit H
MQSWLDSLIASGAFGPHPSRELVYVLAITIACAIVLFLIAVPFASVVTWVERRVWARIQSRIGPNRVGPNGFLQWLADGIKHVCKEDLIPAEADARLFKLAPYLVVLAFILPWAVIPFSSVLILADLNIGILYITAVPALTVIGVLMAGWASNNKWSLIGGIRSAAQIISYEIPAGISIFPIVLMTGTLSMQGIISAQGWTPDRWFIFANPFCLIAAVIFFVSSLAENNRTPFDLPEAESELVAGFD